MSGKNESTILDKINTKKLGLNKKPNMPSMPPMIDMDDDVQVESSETNIIPEEVSIIVKESRVVAVEPTTPLEKIDKDTGTTSEVVPVIDNFEFANIIDVCKNKKNIYTNKTSSLMLDVTVKKQISILALSLSTTSSQVINNILSATLQSEEIKKIIKKYLQNLLK